MPEKALKLVLSFDAASQSFKPAAHNLPVDQALSFASDLPTTQVGTQTRIIQQKTRHKATAADNCNPCKKAAETATGEFHAAQKQSQAESSSGENESE
jgi:hypothetical protein